MKNRRVNVRGIIWREGKLLAVKHKNDDGSEVDYWATPGGGLDPHEPLVAGLEREIAEEMGVAARVGKLLFVQQYPCEKPGTSEELEFFFHVENPEDFAGAIDLAATSHGMAEIVRVEFITPADELLLPRFLSHIDIAAYVEGTQPVYLFDALQEPIK